MIPPGPPKQAQKRGLYPHVYDWSGRKESSFRSRLGGGNSGYYNEVPQSAVPTRPGHVWLWSNGHADHSEPLSELRLEDDVAK